jgi:hypothetical protein
MIETRRRAFGKLNPVASDLPCTRVDGQSGHVELANN